MRTLLALLVFFMSLLLVSCNRGENQLKNIDLKLTQAEHDSTGVNKSDLETLSAQLDELQSDVEANRGNYTDEQIKEVGRLKGRYLALTIKAGLNDFKDDIKDAGIQLEGIIEGIKKD